MPLVVTDVLVKLPKGEAASVPVQERAVVPYDPLLTLKKGLVAAVVSGLAIVGGVLLDWLLLAGNLSMVLQSIGVKGALGALAIPVLHATIVAARNYLSARHGVYYEKRPDNPPPALPKAGA